MSGRSFLDTNVLVYALDPADRAKQERARAVLAADSESLTVSGQVLGEFYVVVTRKGASPLHESQAELLVELFATMRTVPVDRELVNAAVKTSREAQLSYWDALIVEAAATSGCDRLLTEDLTDGATLRGVRIENPFAG